MTLKQARRMTLLALGLILGALNASAQGTGVDQNWAYDTPVAPLARPAWVDRAIFFEVAYNDPLTTDAQRLAPWAQKIVDSGSVILAAAPPEWVERLHKHGIKVVYGMRPFIGEGWMEELVKSHPEWLLNHGEGKAEENAACLISPFGDAMIEVLVNKMKETKVDGYQFDGWYQTGFCRCAGCQELYKKEAGLDVPPQMDPTDLNYRKYLLWRDKKILERALQLRTAIKAVNPEAILVNWSNNDANGAYPSSMPESLNAVFDLTTKEWWDAFDVYSIWLNKRMRGSAGDRPPIMEPYAFLRWLKDIDSGVGHGSSMPREELFYRLHEAMAMGAGPWTWPGVRSAWSDKDWELFTTDLAAFMPYVHETKGLKYAACLDSYSTLQMSQIPLDIKEFHKGLAKRIDEKVAGHRGGVARALLEEHIPFDVIAEHNVTPELLAQYKVLVLPNNACMSERLAGVIREYVQNGGGLVATFESSLRDGLGERRTDFALADLFRAHYVESRAEGPNQITFTSAAHPVTADPHFAELIGPGRASTFWGRYADVKADSDAAVPLAGVERSYHENPTAPERKWTPLVASEHEKGRVAYFPAAIDSAYFLAGYPYQRLLLANAVRWAAGAEPTVQVEAPKAVLAGFFTKPAKGGGQQVIVHLLNGINTTTGHGAPYEKEYAIREEIVPVHDIKVTFATNQPQPPVREIKLIPDGTMLKPGKVANGWQVTVPKMGLHSVVVAEYGE